MYFLPRRDFTLVSVETKKERTYLRKKPVIKKSSHSFDDYNEFWIFCKNEISWAYSTFDLV